MKSKLVLLVVTIAFIVSCGSPKKNQIVAKKASDKSAKSLAKKDKDDKLVCTSTHRVGTHFKSKTCTTKASREKDQQNVNEIYDQHERIRTQTLTGDRSGG